jgi:hypothetical protein
MSRFLPYLPRVRARRGPVAVVAMGLVLVAAVVGSSAPSSAATGAFSLDRLRVGGSAGPENYVFAAGDVVYPEGGVDAGSYYKVVVTDASSAVRNPLSPCGSAAAFTSADNTYRVQSTDPVSTATSWKLTLQQFRTSSCSGTPTKTASKKFFVAKATAYADSALTTPRGAFGASGTAYVAVAGLNPNGNNWSITWIAPSGSVACANTSGGDRPKTSVDGRLPNTGYLQYRPSTSSTVSTWNIETNYETRPCPSFTTANDGLWKLRLALDSTDVVVVPVFTSDTSAPPAPTIDSGPADPSNSSGAALAFSDSEPGVGFLCQLDGSGFAACSSPKSYGALGEGTHSFQLKARDAAGNESAVASRSWTVDATAPLVTLLAPASGSSTTSTTPTFSGSAGIASGDAQTITVRIYSGSTIGGSAVETLAASRRLDATYQVDATPPLAGGAYVAQAEQVDAAGNIGRSTPNTFTVDPPIPPANTSAPTISGSAQVGQTLTAAPGSWSGTPPLSYAYQWRRCDAAGAGCSDLLAATGSSYVLAPGDAGSTIRVSVTASNGAGSASASSAATAIVAAAPVCAPRSSSYSGQITGTAGLIAYWRLGEASGTVACDSAGANNGSYQSGTVLARPGALAGDPDTAVGFDGNRGWVQVPHDPALSVGDRFAIEAWVKRGAISTSGNQVVAAKQNDAWVLMFDPANQLILRKSNNGNVAASSVTVTDTSSWHHVAATKDGAAVKLYVDGADVTGSVTNLTMSDNTLPLAIGQSSSTAYFNGSIDEVALYRAPLTAAQVGAHYAAGVPAAQAPANTSAPTISGSAQVGQTLTAAPGSWSGTPPLSYAYQWRRCDEPGNVCTDIAGATAPSYGVVALDVGATLRALVTASNSGGSATAGSAGTSVVAPLPSPNTDPVVAAAGDIACDPSDPSFGGDLSTECQQRATSDLLVGGGFANVLPLGDNQYECGGFNAYLQSYDPTWGRVKSITRPVPGNHEYQTSGGTDCDPGGNASGYFTYFGSAAGPPGEGYYSFDVGEWHVIALNSNCSAVAGCDYGSPQEEWLRADLQSHSNACTLAYWHHPRFTSGSVGDDSSVAAFWEDLQSSGVDVVLNGHAHGYERFAPQDGAANYDPARGMREFVIGTGGDDFHAFAISKPLSETREDDTFGVLTLTLHSTGYDWRFLPVVGRSFADSGSTSCH